MAKDNQIAIEDESPRSSDELVVEGRGAGKDTNTSAYTDTNDTTTNTTSSSNNNNDSALGGLQSSIQAAVDDIQNEDTSAGYGGVNRYEAALIYDRLRKALLPAIGINLAMCWIKDFSLSHSMVLFRLHDGRLPDEDMEDGNVTISGFFFLLLLIATSIAPFWTTPKISSAKLNAMGVPPQKFVAIILCLACGLNWLEKVFAYHWVIILFFRLFISLLLNEIKWSQVYFISGWFPQTEYLRVFIYTQWAAFVITWGYEFFWSFILALGVWPTPVFLLEPCGYVAVAWYLYHKVPEFPNQSEFLPADLNDKYVRMIESDPTFQPLDWNHPDSYDFYKIDLKSHSKLHYYIYFWLQFL
ncbi:hypothetical protein B0I72DRAFT_8590 [Yarrowia lipolytica]|jgi:hypothetical protein|uniref:YALI0E05687p n=2 Tax=Yarrowia lipolytica TaxID=4952 RepID=Q6C6W6_YARLI|nr:YALI0E05687p [Yarrowia lipolytica CLIB122]AOW05006.1 hypothetical protein YALI1_E06697g [Yarrowia lipolytica]KAB8286177.1 hypothetical protein BKA91DRAFT_14164 [Yarrowia lipolytica]KAE8171500.1 hypothetical protein BKA90DRAFT_25905 [Yarrowia lipolytica]KAJ8056574.1 hypothetical protein LXG23DRAFT_33468 [Yarrowia lipolytica]QNQ00329.1 Hypothetical protein YALI2_E01644g [Yarrowia lipolytica]|eukprot:XP_503596.1 YALI0E05687p [Yarrowia lipolytica CLIB122]